MLNALKYLIHQLTRNLEEWFTSFQGENLTKIHFTDQLNDCFLASLLKPSFELSNLMLHY